MWYVGRYTDAYSACIRFESDRYQHLANGSAREKFGVYDHVSLGVFGVYDHVSLGVFGVYDHVSLGVFGVYDHVSLGVFGVYDHVSLGVLVCTIT